MRHGVRVGVDPGDARIGVARSDPTGFLATPVATVPRGKGDARRVAKIVRDEEAVEVVVGLPRNLHGRETPSTEKARAFADELARKVHPVPVRLVDERLTTVTAESVLREQGRHGQRRRAVVDQVAAVVILQHALDTERASGAAPGERVAVEIDPVSVPAPVVVPPVPERPAPERPVPRRPVPRLPAPRPQPPRPMPRPPVAEPDGSGAEAADHAPPGP